MSWHFKFYLFVDDRDFIKPEFRLPWYMGLVDRQEDPEEGATGGHFVPIPLNLLWRALHRFYYWVKYPKLPETQALNLGRKLGFEDGKRATVAALKEASAQEKLMRDQALMRRSMK